MADVETPRVRLVVKGARGIGETQASESGAFFDPYCQVQCGDVVLRTAAIAKTTTPTWCQKFTFGIKKPLGDVVRFKVFGLREHGRDVLLGSASLLMKTLTPDTLTTHELALVDANDVTCGHLSVDATYEPKFMASTLERDADTSRKESMALSAPGSPPAKTREELSPSLMEKRSAGMDPSLTTQVSSVGAPDALQATKEPEPPNIYVVTILAATGLLACDGTGIEATSDPYVRLKCTKNPSQQTKTQQQTLTPSWRQNFYFSITPNEKQRLELIVEDSDLLTSDFMGRCVIDLDLFLKRYQGKKQTFWLALEQQPTGNKKELSSDLSSQRKMNYGYGKICLAIETRYLDRDISTLEQGEMDHVTEIPTNRGLQRPGSVPEDDVENDLNVDDINAAVHESDEENNEDARRTEAESEWQRREEERKKMLAELSNVQFQSGDYQIRVRIIEVRDLQSMDANGLCDPVVAVECLGQRQHTAVKPNQLSCVFDEYLYFDFKDVDKEVVEQGSIKISVLDADGPGTSANRSVLARSFDDLIGFFSVDVPYVYFQPDHELKRKWVALVGGGTSNSDCIQGYVQLSIAVLGPGDKMKLFDPMDDKDPDERLVKSKADISSIVLVPPRVNQKLSFLVLTIYRVEELPDMDYSLMMQGGIDGYVRAYFAGQDVLETKKVTVKGSENLSVTFNQELWFPVLLPTMSDHIFLSVWDWDMTTADQLVANILRPFSFKQVQRYPDQFQQVWANLYGPRVGYDTDSSPHQWMQNHPAHASTYRGRMLLSLRVQDDVQSVKLDAHVRNALTTAVVPSMKKYTLRIALFYGTEIPVFSSKTNWNRNSRMSLSISLGRHCVESSRVDNVNGICHFNQYLDILHVELPAHLDHVPDVFVYLVRRSMSESRCICFARFRAADVFCSDTELFKTIAPPQWVSLHEDKVLDELKDHDFKGNVLMNLRLEDSSQAKHKEEEEIAQNWRQYANTAMQYTKYVLFVHVFQGKNLPAADVDGLLDPYVKVVCFGSEGKVSTRMSTRDPCFYETVVLEVELPQAQMFLPKVSVQVYDWDRFNADDFVGGLKLSLLDFPQLSSSDYTKLRASGEYAAPRPKWYSICYEQPGDNQGELLLSFDLIKKDTPGVLVEPPESIRPPCEDAFVEIMCLGCRGLQPSGFMPINTPFAKFEIGEITKTNRPKFTNPSSKPSSRNPNFLQRVLVPVKLPVDALFAPRLNITVYDQLLGGYYKPILGVCSVDLSRKMPFSNGKPNPLYMDADDPNVPRGSNPYVDYGADFSTFPGTIPSEKMHSQLSNLASRPRKLGAIDGCLSGSFGMYDDDEPPHYMQEREILTGALEETLTSPFETFPLFRDAMSSSPSTCKPSEQSMETYHLVGKFKGTVRIVKSREDPMQLNLEQFLNPQPYLIHVYVLDALHLHPKDGNNRCDPYLRVSVGDGLRCEQMVNDRENYQSETLMPKFHKMYEFQATLPGASELKLEVLDYDAFALSTLPTGLSKALNRSLRTIVDGDDFVGATLIDLEDRWFSAKWQALGHSATACCKPLELRPLFAPWSTFPQGYLRLWVDIFAKTQMHVVKPLDISLPPPQLFEVRVIIYKAKNVTPGDFTDLSDLFVKCWLQNRHDQSQNTDIHWRARHGRASFNWRMKFDIQLPLDPENQAERGDLHLQLWDRDIMYDDCLADTIVDLTPFFKTAFKTKQTVNVFAKPKPIRIRSSPRESCNATSRRVGYAATEDAAWRSSHVFISIPEEKDMDHDRKPLLGEEETDDESDVDADKESAASLVKSFLHRFGMGDDPDDATWLTLATRDSRTGERVHAGELLVSVEILPKPLADVRAAGLGRSEPNAFPYLPEPADRLHLSAMWNPCYVLEAVMGPTYYRTFASFFLATIMLMLLVIAGPLINVLLQLFEFVPQPWGLMVFFLVVAMLLLVLLYPVYRCRQAFIRVMHQSDEHASRRRKRKETAADKSRRRT